MIHVLSTCQTYLFISTQVGKTANSEFETIIEQTKHIKYKGKYEARRFFHQILVFIYNMGKQMTNLTL
jgi:hypothetical protein